MAKLRSKRYRKMVEGLDSQKRHTAEEAVKLLKSRANAKFDESVELAINLAIDTKQADQLVRGSLSLPHGIGKSVRVIAFAEGPDAEAARAAGAMEVGAQDLADKILGGWLDFDVAVAHPNMMKFVGKLGKALGPKGLMPSPKSGTVTPNVGQAVKEFSAGKIEFRNDKEGNVHMLVGKISFPEDKLTDNVKAALAHIIGQRSTSQKNDFVLGVSLSSTMGPGIKLAF